MNNSKHFKSFNFLFTVFTLLTITFLASCGGDEGPEPVDCSSLELSATVEGNTITVSATGGEGPYVFSLNGTEQQGTTFTDLEADTYAVSVTDANDCTDDQNLTVIDPCANFSISASASAYEITIALTSGEAPFDYEIAYGDKSLTGISDVRSFTLKVEEAAATAITVTDASDCILEAELSVEAIRTFTDSRDGQEYLTIKIGDQIWFAESFNYNTNTADSTSSWYYFNDSTTHASRYGRLYTWYVATSEAFAPEGWSVPTLGDFQQLVEEVGNTEAEQFDALSVGGSSNFELELAGIKFRGGETNDFFGSLGEFAFLFASGAERAPDRADILEYVLVSKGVNIGDFGFKANAQSIRLIKK